MITQPTNIDYLIPATQMYVGDVSETTFAYSLVRTALTYGVKALQKRWNNRYFVYVSGMMIDSTHVMSPDGIIEVSTMPDEYDVFRNSYNQTFYSSAPPVVDQTDETPIILSAAIILRRVTLTSSVAAMGSWSTPDLSFSNIQGSKQVMNMLSEDQKALDAFFAQRLAHPQKDTIIESVNAQTYSIVEIREI